jgi:hypothetical protein
MTRPTAFKEHDIVTGFLALADRVTVAAIPMSDTPHSVASRAAAPPGNPGAGYGTPGTLGSGDLCVLGTHAAPLAA